MKKAHAYKLEDKAWNDFQEICKIQTQQGPGKFTPAALVEKYVNDYVEKYKYLLEGRK